MDIESLGDLFGEPPEPEPCTGGDPRSLGHLFCGKDAPCRRQRLQDEDDGRRP